MTDVKCLTKEESLAYVEASYKEVRRAFEALATTRALLKKARFFCIRHRNLEARKAIDGKLPRTAYHDGLQKVITAIATALKGLPRKEDTHAKD